MVNKFLLGGVKFMPEMHLRKPWFTFGACGSFTKNKKKYKNLQKQEIPNIFIKHDKAYENFKDLTRKKASDEILHNRAFNIAKNPKYDGYQSGLASMFYKFFDKKPSGSGIKNDNISNQELAEELHKPVIRKFKKRKVHSPFIDNIWGADLADM